MGFRYDGVTDPRNDLVIQIPFALNRKSLDEKKGWHFGLYTAGHDYINNQEVKSSNTGLVRFYYLKHSTKSLYTLLPNITVYRSQTIRFNDFSDSQRTFGKDAWILPGLILGVGMTKRTFFHADIEIHDWYVPNNHRICFALSHKIKPNWSMSLVTESRNWDFSIQDNVDEYSQRGYDNSISLRSIHRFKTDSNWPIGNMTFSIGYEDFYNQGNQVVIQGGNISRQGSFFMLNVSTGKMMW